MIYTDGAYSPRLKFWKKDKRRGGSRSTLEYEIQEEQRTQVIKLTNELDAIYIAANLKGKNTENIRWWNVLQQQDVPNNIVRRMQMTANTAIALTRAKRAAAAIMWANGYPNGSA